MGVDEVRLTKEALGWSADARFLIPDEALVHFRQAVDQGAKIEAGWQALFGRYEEAHPDLSAEWKRRMAGLREKKLYVDDGESNRGAIRITAPVFLGPAGRVVGSIGITVLSGGLTDQRRAWFCERVVLAGRQASERLASFGKAEREGSHGR